MTNARPSDPDPAQSPDVDDTGSAPAGVTPDSDSTSMQSDSAARKQAPTERQSPTPQPGRTSPVVWIVVIAIVVLLLVVGLVGYAFEVF
ncbi:hypothetical protein BXY47_0128 [Dietzia kunjamensis]|uniref:Uncharacterized protein n=1 Tax=Dietzia maris TaxID=37915 RepID=A0AAE4QXJ2_9ACTN|nr:MULTISPECIES: hypothetical protein [Dietzia]MBB1011219.1 hypothetical protein [Dietzia kunjamensis]MCT1435023.1 hypothetical protein [Dietzia maris]MCT1519858.1 hypothetical protein [Dietzia maris]MDV6298494.1 hypothetical protein [Dietzia maris]RKE68921.1 hypothetical protein BXY47_0128 [Dietzia kunjamensis]